MHYIRLTDSEFACLKEEIRFLLGLDVSSPTELKTAISEVLKDEVEVAAEEQDRTLTLPDGREIG